MPDYRAMYLVMIRETEKAIRILTEAQHQCEELYIKEEEYSPIVPLFRQDEKKEKP